MTDNTLAGLSIYRLQEMVEEATYCAARAARRGRVVAAQAHRDRADSYAREIQRRLSAVVQPEAN